MNDTPSSTMARREGRSSLKMGQNYQGLLPEQVDDVMHP
jgi:hypothetical protein